MGYSHYWESKEPMNAEDSIDPYSEHRSEDKAKLALANIPEDIREYFAVVYHSPRKWVVERMKLDQKAKVSLVGIDETKEN